MSTLEAFTQPLRVPALRQLSLQLGLNINGTKPSLLSRIHALSQSPPAASTARILSIDMGIRNLAYCVLKTSPSHQPQIESWARVAVPAFPASSTSISLPHFAAATHTLAQALLETHTPLSHILVEHQRWRSGSSAAVLEWTIRINTLEAMLYATLHGLRARGVESVDPGRVVRFWVPENGSTTPAETKKAKKEVLRRWLREGKVELVGEEVERSAELLMLGNAPRGTVKKDGEKLRLEERKVDDLADCVLQALAWSKWQENRRTLLLEGRLPGSEGEEISGIATATTSSPKGHRVRKSTKPKPQTIPILSPADYTALFEVKNGFYIYRQRYDQEWVDWLNTRPAYREWLTHHHTQRVNWINPGTKLTIDVWKNYLTGAAKDGTPSAVCRWCSTAVPLRNMGKKRDHISTCSAIPPRMGLGVGMNIPIAAAARKSTFLSGT